MSELKGTVVQAMEAIVGAENVISDLELINANTPPMVYRLERAYDFTIEHQPLCIVKVHTTEEVSKALKYCNDNDIHVIAKTGCSGSEEQLRVEDDRTIYLDGIEMDKFTIDPENMMATAQCGVPLRVLEEKANALGLTTGHCPQSQPLASMGGLVATRSIGQFSTYYGGIEDLVCGLEAVLPSGEVFEVRPVPRRAAGPDLRHLVIGADGAFCFMTEVTVKLFSYYPDNMWKGGFVVKDFQTGLKAVRDIMVQGWKPSVVRLYDKADADANYGSVQLKDDEAFMFFSVEGPGDVPKVHGNAIKEIALSYGAVDIGTKAVDHWFETRNNLCDFMASEAEKEKFRQDHIIYATHEVCADWTEVGDVYKDVMTILPEKIDNLVLLGGHVSHSYVNGTNIYFVYKVVCRDPAHATEENYAVMDEICNIMLKYKTGTIVHHHGTGKLRARRIKEELGSSYPLMRALKTMMDPKGIMNPGCLLPKED